MNCPACQSGMGTLDFAGVELDFCPACQGVWLDPGELAVLAPIFKASTEIPNLDLRVVFERMQKPPLESSRSCPACSVPLAPFNYGVNSNVMLDRCPICRGLWFDPGELMRVARFIKGHPKLDRMAGAVADDAAQSENRRFPERKWASSLLHADLPSGNSGLLDALFSLAALLKNGRD